MTTSTNLEDKIFKTVFKNTPIPALIIEPKSTVIIESNKAANLLYGMNVSGKKLSDIHQVTQKEYTSLRKKLLDKKKLTIQTKHVTAKKKMIDVECHMSVVNFNGQSFFYSLNRDVTDELLKKEKLVNEASMDDLTNIPNRRFFINILQSYLANLKRYQEKFSLIYFDIDNFKYYNDHYGHEFGDKILKKTIASISKEKRASDFLARLSGDEFVLIFNKVFNEDNLATICKNLNQIIRKESKHISPPVTVSIGGYLVTKFESYEKILAKTDRAMYRAKKQGGNTFYIANSKTD